MNLTIKFLYDMNNLALYDAEIFHVLIAIIVSIVFLIAARYFFLYHIGAFVVWREKRAIAAKKHILGDLILMKDIQSELEKDIEKASLRATFQG